MRTHGFRLFAIASMLALLSGGQLCMLVQCSPKRAPGAAHGCCTKAAEKPAPQAPAPGPSASAKPCCISVTLAHAPELEPPAAVDANPLAALLVAALLAAPPAAGAPSPPGEIAAPPPAPPLAAAGSRAPPLG